MAKCIKYCIKRMLKTASENPMKPFTIIDAYNKRVYDTAAKAQRVIDAQNQAHVNSNWKFVMFTIEIDERHSHLEYDPDDIRCNFIKPDNFTGNRTTALKNKARENAKERAKEESRKKAQAHFDARLNKLLDKMTPEQRKSYIDLTMKEGD
ncbi:hypothetical protein J4061_004474 [Salmonella enterica]|nr:hypothetical protein [Salmonella enterica]